MQDSNFNTIGELIEPNPVSFSLLTPGWFFICLLFIILLIYIAARQYFKYQRNKYRREAILLINTIMQSDEKESTKLFKTAETIKRVAFISYDREEQAMLHGLNWLNFLAEKQKNKDFFSPEVKQLLSHSLYRGSQIDKRANNLTLLKNECINWIKKHDV